LVQASRALSVMHHELSIAHANILFSWFNQDKVIVKLGDFGSSRDAATEAHTQMSTLNGIGRTTEDNIAPEAIEEQLGIGVQKSDIFV
jgi:serine/threonine protein kinase